MRCYRRSMTYMHTQTDRHRESESTTAQTTWKHTECTRNVTGTGDHRLGVKSVPPFPQVLRIHSVVIVTGDTCVAVMEPVAHHCLVEKPHAKKHRPSVTYVAEFRWVRTV